MRFVQKDFRSANFEKLTDLYCRFMPERYAISPQLLVQQTVGCPVFDWGASIVLYDEDMVPAAFAAVKKSAARLYHGPDPDSAYLTAIAYSHPDAGGDCLAFARSVLKNRGASRLVFGQDTRHLFPGCPADAGALELLLTVEGFEPGSDQFDLERDLSDFAYQGQVPEDAEYRMLTDADRSSVKAFFSENFSGRWQHDVLEKASVEGIGKSVFGLLIGGEVKGFALLQDWSCERPIGGAVWNLSMGENWGSLGPIGVDERIRGKHYGGALLGRALEELKRRGVRRCSIDWTGLVDFYSKFGFEVSRTYHSMALKLD